jgi:hypothetical protein
MASPDADVGADAIDAGCETSVPHLLQKRAPGESE